MRRAVRFHFFQRDSRWIGLIGHMDGIYVGINFFFHWGSGDRRCVNESFAHDLPGGNGEASLQDQTHRELVYRPLQFRECGQDFTGTHNEALSVAMCAHNPDCAPLRIYG